MPLEEILATAERIVRIVATVLAAYFVALWIAAIWWTFRDIRARTNDFFSKFFEVRDRYESYMDTTELYSLRYEKHIREGKFKRDEAVDFDQSAHRATYKDKVVPIPPRSQDVLSALYYIRALPLEVGQWAQITSRGVLRCRREREFARPQRVVRHREAVLIGEVTERAEEHFGRRVLAGALPRARGRRAVRRRREAVVG